MKFVFRNLIFFLPSKFEQPFDVNKTTETLEPEVSNGGGGLFVPKDRPKYIAPASKKSVLGIKMVILFYFYIFVIGCFNISIYQASIIT